jgi:hypothetical protein
VAAVWGLGVVAVSYAAPAKALYARLALPLAGQKVMLLKFRGEGDSSIRNVLVADKNLNGALEPSEALAGRVQERAPTGYSFYTFPAITLPPTATGGAAWSLGLMHYRFTSGSRTQEYFGCSASGQADRGEERWTYQAGGELEARPDPAEAPLAGFTGKPALNLQTKLDEANPGQTGLGVSVGWPTLQVHQVARGSATQSAGAPESVLVTLKVSDSRGQVVHEAEAKLEDMGFG